MEVSTGYYHILFQARGTVIVHLTMVKNSKPMAQRLITMSQLTCGDQLGFSEISRKLDPQNQKPVFLQG